MPAETVNQMNPGSVVIDLASSSGGNCEPSEDQKTIKVNGVTVIGDSNLPARMPQHASLLFSNNVMNYLTYMIKDGAINMDMDDVIIGGSCISKA